MRAGAQGDSVIDHTVTDPGMKMTMNQMTSMAIDRAAALAGQRYKAASVAGQR